MIGNLKIRKLPIRRGSFAMEALVATTLLMLVAISVTKFARNAANVRRNHTQRTSNLRTASNAMARLTNTTPSEREAVSQQLVKEASALPLKITLTSLELQGVQGQRVDITIPSGESGLHSLVRLRRWLPIELATTSDEETEIETKVRGEQDDE